MSELKKVISKTATLKTLKDLPLWRAPHINRELSVEAYRLIKELAIPWIKAFQNGECHTDFAADQRKGQENIMEWIEHVFNIPKEELEAEGLLEKELGVEDIEVVGFQFVKDPPNPHCVITKCESSQEEDDDERT